MASSASRNVSCFKSPLGYLCISAIIFQADSNVFWNRIMGVDGKIAFTIKTPGGVGMSFGLTTVESLANLSWSIPWRKMMPMILVCGLLDNHSIILLNFSPSPLQSESLKPGVSTSRTNFPGAYGSPI